MKVEIDEQTENLINRLADDVIDNLDADDIKFLKKNSEYDHFGFGLYIRNNFIYSNDEILMEIDYDELGCLVFDKVVERIKNY